MIGMGKTFLVIVIAAFFFSSCSKEGAKSSFENKIVGNWLVVDSNNNDLVVEWGLFYVSSIKLYSDNSFKLNLGRRVDDSTSKTGTWVLDNNKDSITFYTRVSDIGMILRDTSNFHISIDPNGELILKNGWTSIQHLKWDN